MSNESVTEVQPHEDLLHIVVLKRTLDESATHQLVSDVQDRAVETPRLPIVLDMSRVRFAPSVALGLLVQMSKGFQLDGRRVVLIGVDRRVRAAMNVTRLDRILEIQDTLDQVSVS